LLLITDFGEKSLLTRENKARSVIVVDRPVAQVDVNTPSAPKNRRC